MSSRSVAVNAGSWTPDVEVTTAVENGKNSDDARSEKASFVTLQEVHTHYRASGHQPPTASLFKTTAESNIIAPTPKTPRHHLTEQESRLCREALLSERHKRRIRRTEQKSGSDGAGQTKAKKATRKKAAKRTAADMEVAQYKGLYIPSASAQLADTAGEKEGSTIAEVKETMVLETTAIAVAIHRAATLTEQESRLCREALLSERHERRIRRTEQKSGSDGAGQTKAKKATRKKAAKRTAADMEVAQYKGLYIPSASAQLADTAGEKEGSTIAEVKETMVLETTAIAVAM
ncbi:uncharacterized protein PITG_21715 [Phytophthora infestans T30-4]|uniref:Uncharacterized protein n=1 Tax=Phytophthora infestans (strain T30-4) TaxID=403677 RepID=D0P3X5_PHYIT|nr:uncharacterized protein PITG_21715 [Phytophthora infestans T30-4]EEY62109.1 conserved hypothetical protein [Phytophthora infestans T30-4]|eukprot:XP_002895002.1 conserved hypothetical protein [Phytophthora infestans T30-4]